MNGRRGFLLMVAAMLALSLPILASAQGRDPDYRNDRDDDRYRNDRYDDRYGQYGDRYDNRDVRDSIHRVDRLAKDFQKDLDSALDRSRADGSRREDSINLQARRFRSAVGDLKSRFGNGRDLNRSRNEAARVLQEADQLDRMTRSRWFDSRLASEWMEIRRELRTIERAYGLSGIDNGRGRRNGPWWQNIPLPGW